MSPPLPHPDSETTFEDPNDPGKRYEFGKINDEATIDLSVVVPAYNEEDRLPKMLNETIEYLERRQKKDGTVYEIIIVDDGSKDNTIGVANEYIKKYGTEKMRLLRLLQNSGKGFAVKTGMVSSRGKKMLMVDADAATVFTELESLEKILSSNMAQVAIGSRKHQKQDRDPLRQFVSFVFHLLVLIVGGVVGIQDTQCGFKLYSRKAAKIAFQNQHLYRWAFDVENLYRCQKAGLKIIEVPVQWTEVPGSKLSVVKATINMFQDMIRMRYHYITGEWTLPSPSSSPSSSSSTSTN